MNLNDLRKVSTFGSKGFVSIVGIGTTNPLQSLHVNGTGYFYNNWGGTYPTFFTTSGSGTLIGWNGGAVVDGRSDIINFPGAGTGGFNFVLANSLGVVQSTPLVIRGNGNVGIGKTAPTAALDVVGDIQFTGEIVDVSDRRLKENIQPLPNALETVRKISTYSFTMKDDPKHKVEFGVMAQEMKELIPDIVHIINPVTGHMGVNYISLIPWSIRAIQDLDRDVASLKARVETLEERNRRLEQKNQEIEAKLEALVKRIEGQ